MTAKVVKGAVVAEGNFSLEQMPLLRAKMKNRVALELWRLTLQDLEFLGEFVELDELKIVNCTVGDASALRSLPSLRTLFINDSRFPNGFDFVRDLSSVEELDLLNIRGPFVVPPLDDLRKLSRFRVGGCKGFTDVAAVAAAPHLHQVELVASGLEPESLMPLMRHDSLNYLSVTFATQAKTRVFKELLDQHGKVAHPG